MKENRQYDCTKITYECDFCRKEFITKQWKLDLVNSGERKGIYCSNSCSAFARGNNRTRICENCGKSYEVMNCRYDNRNTRFCSRECYLEWCNKEKSNRAIEKECVYCGKKFSVIPSRSEQRYCGHTCLGIDSIRDISGQVFNSLTVLRLSEDRIINRVTWVCRCDCGNEVVALSSDIIHGHITSCGCKRRSAFEESIYKWLLNRNIDFIDQHTFSDCKSEQLLRFDFYLPNENICIEADGEQHYYPIEGWGGDSEFEKTKKRDNIKDIYCEQNNIRLIRIPYWEKNNIDEILSNQLHYKNP